MRRRRLNEILILSDLVYDTSTRLSEVPELRCQTLSFVTDGLLLQELMSVRWSEVLLLRPPKSDANTIEDATSIGTTTRAHVHQYLTPGTTYQV